jgi:uncharacterized protein (TIGR03067 family)
MKRFWLSVSGLGIVMFLSGAVFTGDWLNNGLAANEGADPKKAEATRLEGTWKLSECDNGGRTIGYHPQLKISPGYALLMFAYTAKYPEKGSGIKGMRWHFAQDRLTVEWVLEEGKKESRHKLGEFTSRFDDKGEPATMDLTWQPPGLEGMVPEKKGQVVHGIYRRDADKLEVVLKHTGKDRPREFKADRTSYRLVFQKAKN